MNLFSAAETLMGSLCWKKVVNAQINLWVFNIWLNFVIYCWVLTCKLNPCKLNPEFLRNEFHINYSGILTETNDNNVYLLNTCCLHGQETRKFINLETHLCIVGLAWHFLVRCYHRNYVGRHFVQCSGCFNFHKISLQSE